MTYLLLILAILGLILLVGIWKWDPFLSFIIIALGLGMSMGMDVSRVAKSIQNGIGATLGDLILIIGFGAMLGKLVAVSGAAQQITDTFVRLFGKRGLPWGMALAGLIIGIPLFYNAGFVVAMPLVFAVAYQTQLPILTLGIPMLAALSVSHGYLPPHPAPAAIASQLHADVGKTLLYGLLIALPAISLAGPIFGQTLAKYGTRVSLAEVVQPVATRLPSLKISLLIALLPVILLSGSSVLTTWFPSHPIVALLAQPFVSMLVSVGLAMYFLGIRQGFTLNEVNKHLEDAFKGISLILLIIAGAGALKQVLADSGISEALGKQIQTWPVNPYVLGWLMAGLIRVAIGSATIAGLTAVGLIAPVVQSQTGISPELMVIAIGAGSLILSHVNDGGFWLYKEYFQLTIRETFLTWTLMETWVAIIGLLGVLALHPFVT